MTLLRRSDVESILSAEGKFIDRAGGTVIFVWKRANELESQQAAQRRETAGNTPGKLAHEIEIVT